MRRSSSCVGGTRLSSPSVWELRASQHALHWLPCPRPSSHLSLAPTFSCRGSSCVSFLAERALLSVSSCSPCCSHLACGFSLYCPFPASLLLHELICLPGVLPSPAALQRAWSDCHLSADLASPLGSDLLSYSCLRSAYIYSGDVQGSRVVSHLRVGGKERPSCIGQQGGPHVVGSKAKHGWHGSPWGPVSAR